MKFPKKYDIIICIKYIIAVSKQYPIDRTIRQEEKIMDNFAEQLVKNKPTKADKSRNIALIGLGIVLTIILALFGLLSLNRGIITLLAVILAIVIGIFTFFFYRNTKIEYEYTFTNGELDIDKIINQAKRVEMLTVDVSKFTAFGKYDDNTSEETEDMTVILATDNILEHEFFADFPHEDYGNTRLIFAPNEKLISAVTNALHPSIRNKVKAELKNSYLSGISDNI